MIAKISRILLLIIIIIVCAHFIPKFYWMKFEKSVRTPFISYSPIINDFIISKVSGEKLVAEMTWKDSDGNYYTREEVDSLLPFMNYRQLVASNRMPDSVGGIPVPVDSVRFNGFSFRLSASKIKFREIQLYSLLESKSGRVKLEMPIDFFRINDRMEFIISATNKIDEEKSKIFTEALNNNGFQFPARIIAGNPTTRKPFDEGYFILDSKNDLYHVKMVEGQPFCVNTNIRDDLKIVHISAFEMSQREFYAYVVTEDNLVFLLSYDGYKMIQLPLENYDHQKDNLMIIGDLFYRTISIIRDNNIQVIVTNRSYKPVDSYFEKWESNEESTAGIAAAYIFPFAIDFNDYNSPNTHLFIDFSDSRSIILTLITVFIAFMIIRHRNQSISKSFVDLIIVLLTGIYGLIAITTIKNVD
jgi:hypothetical protein